MTDGILTMAQRVAEAANRFQQQRTGVTPKAVTVVLCADTLVITLHGALTPAEQALAKDPVGGALVQEFHRQLFVTSIEQLREEIQEIMGVDLILTQSDVETATGAVVHAFNSGTMVQVFLLAAHISQEAWNSTE